MQRVFVGDVQGCADELDELLARCRSAFGDAFETWLVGDLVNRGPASLRVLERVRSLEEAGCARSVLGNHELSLLRVAFGQREPRPNDSFLDVLEAPDADAWVEWLLRRPVAIVDHLGETPFVLVHAGLAPDWELATIAERAHRVEARLSSGREEARRLLAASPREDADRDFLDLVTSCRSVDARGAWSEQEPQDPADAWHRRWSARAHDYGVVYGHWSLQGLHVAPRLRGLDTGCVHHARGRDGYLTAWVPDPDAARPFDVPDAHFLRVRAHRRYWPFGKSSGDASASLARSRAGSS